MFKLISFLLKITFSLLLISCSPFIFIVSIMLAKSWAEAMEFTKYIVTIPFNIE